MNKPDLSISVPTFNEAKNIETLTIRVFDSLKKYNIQGELIIVDDKSPDGTAAEAERMAKSYPVRVHVRENRRGPGPAIMDGIRLAEAPIACIMDGDLSHPPEALPEMYKLIKEGKAQLVVGSRHVKGGGTSEWVWYRKLFSWGARLLGRFLTPVTDLTSGFFMFDKKILEGADIRPIGCKVGLELMVKGNHQGKVVEYPIIFQERTMGESKMGWRETKEYIKHLFALTFYKLAKILRLK
jgi:dolichol-phosphate mannosyltransferase